MRRQIKALNEEHTDLSNEVKIMLAMFYGCIHAASTGGDILCRALKNAGITDTTIQNNKHYINDALKAMERCIKLMNLGYEDDILEAMSKDGEYLERSEAVRHLSNDMMDLLVGYLTRQNTDNVIKAVYNFKPEPKFEVEAVREFLGLTSK